MPTAPPADAQVVHTAVPRLDGAGNFRDLAGTPAAGGRTLRPGVLMRSDALHRLSAADWQRLATAGGVGLRTIVDLRSDAEAERAPTQPPPQPWSRRPLRHLRAAVANDVRADATISGRIHDDPTPEGARRLMVLIYSHMPEAFVPTWRAIVDALLDDDHPAASETVAPMLVHCAAGKDRTGFVVGLLLHALGASYDTILADYLRTPRAGGAGDPRLPLLRGYLSESSERTLSDEVLLPIIDVSPDYLGAAWQALDDAFGGADAYLERHAGLDAARRERLRDRLLA